MKRLLSNAFNALVKLIIMAMFLGVMLDALMAVMSTNIQQIVQRANQSVELNWLLIGFPEVISISRFVENAELRYYLTAYCTSYAPIFRHTFPHVGCASYDMIHIKRVIRSI